MVLIPVTSNKVFCGRIQVLDFRDGGFESLYFTEKRDSIVD